MKYLRKALLLSLVFLAAFSACARAEEFGFGRINADSVAIRKEAGGEKITRLQKGSSVWITGSGTDGKGEKWYHVRAEEGENSNFRNRTGWVKAEFVDAGSGLWHDIKTVKAAIFGMIALKTDGTVICAGENMITLPPERYTRLRDIRQVGNCTVGWVFYAVDGSGRLFRDGDEVKLKSRIRLTGCSDLISITEDNRLQVSYEGGTGLKWIWPQSGAEDRLEHVVAMADCNWRNLFLMDDGQVFCACTDDTALDYPEPDWEAWTDAVSIDASLCSYGTYELNGRTRRKYVLAFAAVRKDGTVIAAPAELAALTADWQDIRKTAIGSDFILGLKQDGTVVAAGVEGRTPPDVSGWTDIADISNGHTYCVGVKNDGTLVFAGDFEFTEDN